MSIRHTLPLFAKQAQLTSLDATVLQIDGDAHLAWCNIQLDGNGMGGFACDAAFYNVGGHAVADRRIDLCSPWVFSAEISGMLTGHVMLLFL